MRGKKPFVWGVLPTGWQKKEKLSKEEEGFWFSFLGEKKKVSVREKREVERSIFQKERTERKSKENKRGGAICLSFFL